MAKQAGQLYLRSYSEKAILVTGDTYLVKDKMKEMKGSWNRRLSGWIFSKKWRDALLAEFPQMTAKD